MSAAANAGYLPTARGSLTKLMEPLESLAMPAHCALVGVTTTNSWATQTSQRMVRQVYVATNSTQRVAFATLQSTKRPENILGVVTRAAFFPDMPYGVVVELHLAEDLLPGESVHMVLAQVGATTYYSPQPIDDGER